MRDETLPPVELAALASVVRLGESAYAVPIRTDIGESSGRSRSITAVYAALQRLEDRGYVTSWQSEPLPERGGRSRRHYSVTDAGLRALARERALSEGLWQGIPGMGGLSTGESKA